MILVTGGAGYIGSHTCVELLENGYDVVVIDNLSNSHEKSLERVRRITGKDLVFIKADVRDQKVLDGIFKTYSIDCVLHFAGLKAVGESVGKPLDYYTNNLDASLVLCRVMQDNGVYNLVFSSSATVYSSDNQVPLKETSRTGNCSNPYGWTKFMSERIFMDLCNADKRWSIVLLRYFNPVGAHQSALIGEAPQGRPNNLMPFVTQVAVGRRDHLEIFGSDYDTPDGTGVRDYIHVVDLARAHLLAVDYAEKHAGCEAFNIGTGKGTSVLELVNAFIKVNKVDVPYVIGPRRPGDLATVYSEVSKAEKVLGFRAEYDVQDMCRDSWNWQKNNPFGFCEA